jgi:glycosyltransferase involved in cell wall biosynthesis
MLPNWVLGAAESVERSYYDGQYLRMVFAGRVAEEKGVFILPEVVARLVERGHTNLRLDIFGGGDLRRLGHLVSEHGVTDYVTQHGPVPKAELRQWFRQADLLVFPTSADDAMPLAPLEAAAEGCVPLIPAVSGISEWLIDGVSCLKADATTDAYVEVIGQVLRQKVPLEEISRRGVRSVHSDFDIHAVLPAVERELVLAAGAGRMAPGRSTAVQRLALVADAILRRYVMETVTSP